MKNTDFDGFRLKFIDSIRSSLSTTNNNVKTIMAVLLDCISPYSCFAKQIFTLAWGYDYSVCIWNDTVVLSMFFFGNIRVEVFFMDVSSEITESERI